MNLQTLNNINWLNQSRVAWAAKQNRAVRIPKQEDRPIHLNYGMVRADRQNLAARITHAERYPGTLTKAELTALKAHYVATLDNPPRNEGNRHSTAYRKALYIKAKIKVSIYRKTRRALCSLHTM